MNVHIPSVLRTSSSSSWSVVVAAVALAGASAVDVCSLLLLILLLSPHTHHITNNSFQVVVIFVSVVLFWSPLQRVSIPTTKFWRLFMQMDGNKLGIWCRVRSIPLKHNIWLWPNTFCRSISASFAFFGFTSIYALMPPIASWFWSFHVYPTSIKTICI